MTSPLERAPEKLPRSLFEIDRVRVTDEVGFINPRNQKGVLRGKINRIDGKGTDTTKDDTYFIETADGTVYENVPNANVLHVFLTNDQFQERKKKSAA